MILLASASPRRAEILSRHGVKFLIDPSNIDETPMDDESPQSYVKRIAKAKAVDRLSSFKLRGCRLVLAADTCVSVEQRILGKPQSYEHFVSIMELLSGTTHIVYSAVVVEAAKNPQANNAASESLVVETEVTFRKISEEEMQSYWRSGEPKDKAGGYGIQGLAAEFVTGISGSYSNVVGLPICETMQLLDRWKIERYLSKIHV